MAKAGDAECLGVDVYDMFYDYHSRRMCCTSASVARPSLLPSLMCPTLGCSTPQGNPAANLLRHASCDLVVVVEFSSCIGNARSRWLKRLGVKPTMVVDTLQSRPTVTDHSAINPFGAVLPDLSHDSRPTAKGGCTGTSGDHCWRP